LIKSLENVIRYYIYLQEVLRMFRSTIIIEADRLRKLEWASQVLERWVEFA